MDFIQEQNEIRQDYKIKIEKPPLVEFLRGRQTKGTIFISIFAIVVPVVVYYFIFDRSTFPPERTDTCLVDKTYRIPCGRTENVTMDYCDSISCCFDNSTQLCFHYLPSRYFYSNENGEYRRSLDTTPFGKDQAPTVKMSIHELDNNTIQIILHDSSLSLTTVTDRPNKNYRYYVTENMYIDVYRNASNQLLLTTEKGPTIISENYWEWSFQLTDQYLFGLGQTLIDLDDNSSLTKVIYGNDKEHNVLPNFLAYDNGKYHGLIVRHSGPLEVTVLPSKLVSLKSLVGGQIILELSVGPTLPEILSQQKAQRNATGVVDLKTLGVHLCREGSTTSLNEILNEINGEMSSNNTFRYDSDCLHENLLLATMNEQNQGKIDEMGNVIQSIVDMGRSFVLSLPPHVPIKSKLYDATQTLDVFFKFNTTADYKGKYLELDVVYPYFKHSHITTFVQELITEARASFSLWPNYFILGNNWPSDDSFTMKEIDDFQYLPENLITAMSSTLPWNITVENQTQFTDHNNYGSDHFYQIKEALKSEDPVIMTASHSFDTAGPIIIQNVDISWTNFQKAITTILYNSISGFPLTSIPVCGSTSIFSLSQESLCIRWYLMASTAPLFRISSDLPRRDPVSFESLGSKYAANAANWAIDLRYQLLYYFYGVLANEEPLMRPMFYDFENDVETFGLVNQYMVGGDLLVAQPTLPHQSQLRVYLPKSVNTWFSFYGTPHTYNSSTKGWVSLTVVETDWVSFIREGVVLPLVKKEEAEGETAVNRVTLKVALKCESGVNCTATGILKTDAENSFTFSSDDVGLTVENQSNIKGFVLSEIEIFKAGNQPLYLNPIEEIDLVSIHSCSYLEDSFSC